MPDVRPLYALIVIAALIIWGVIADTEKRIDSKIASIAAQRVPAVASLDTQRKCSDQAAKFYRESGWANPMPHIFNNYTDHYAIGLGRCFVTISSTDFSAFSENEMVLSLIEIHDPFEGLLYAEYSDYTEKGKSSTVTGCFVSLHGKPDAHCHSRDEWNVLVAIYR
jgi:hypothetical protein